MATIFSDTFTAGADEELAAHTPDTGTGWTLLISVQNGADAPQTFIVCAASDNIMSDDECNGGVAANSAGVLYTADTTYDSNNYEVIVTVVTPDTLDDVCIIAARIQDSDNMYAVKFSGTAGSGQMYKKVAGSWSTIGSSFNGPAAGSVMKFIVNGSTISVQDDGAEVATANDTSICLAGKAGLGYGAIITSTDDQSSQTFDTFSVNTLTSSACGSSSGGNFTPKFRFFKRLLASLIKKRNKIVKLNPIII